MEILVRNAEIENYICSSSLNIIEILLQDKTTGKNIIWETDGNVRFNDIGSKSPVLSAITPENIEQIRAGSYKSRVERILRVRDKAEVFTPAWICNAQNNLIDDAWLGYIGAFNIEKDKSWEPTIEPIKFNSALGKTWQDYVKLTCLEPACGEAPYLVSRYDSVSGNEIDLICRIGRLDRKLRIINENIAVENKQGWLDWTITAFKCIYGYELQGDSLFIARKNLLYSFIDYYEDRFNEYPDKELLLEIADIISWNLWQMDGLKCVIPGSCSEKIKEDVNLLGEKVITVEKCPGCEKDNMFRHNGIYCNIMNWETNKVERFVDGLSRI